MGGLSKSSQTRVLNEFCVEFCVENRNSIVCVSLCYPPHIHVVHIEYDDNRQDDDDDDDVRLLIGEPLGCLLPSRIFGCSYF